MTFLRRSIFILVAVVTVTCNAQNADINMLRGIHVPAQHSMDKPMLWTSGSVLPLMIAVPVGTFIHGYATTGSPTEKREPFIIASSLITSGAVSLGLKYAVNRPRPFTTYTDITQKDHHVGPYSFPSGHTAQAFALATSVSLCYPKWYVIAPAYVWAIGVGYSRMWLGVHYPSDVLVGAIIGSGSAVLAYYLSRRL